MGLSFAPPPLTVGRGQGGAAATVTRRRHRTKFFGLPSLGSTRSFRQINPFVCGRSRWNIRHRQRRRTTSRRRCDRINRHAPHARRKRHNRYSFPLPRPAHVAPEAQLRNSISLPRMELRAPVGSVPGNAAAAVLPTVRRGAPATAPIVPYAQIDESRERRGCGGCAGGDGPACTTFVAPVLFAEANA